MRALLLANRDDDDPGVVGARLASMGFRFTTAHRESPHEWAELDGTDLVLALGSDWSVYWDHVRPSVEAEVALLRTAHERGVPVLGICFGGQVLAHALGGHVGPTPQPEIGWFAVRSDEPALAGNGPWFQWHSDRFVPPPGATALADSPRAPQAFCHGRALGLQFHPEVDERIVGRWTVAGRAELARHGVDPAELTARTCAEAPRAAGAAAQLVDWFLARVADHPG